MSLPIDRLPLHHERDVGVARQRARDIARLIGFDRQDQARIAAAVSEIARNAVCYGKGGNVEYELEGERPPQILMVRISDHGPGIPDLQRVFDGRRDATGRRGRGIAGARRLMDQCQIASGTEGTVVVMKKLLDSRAAPVTASDLDRIRAALSQSGVTEPIDELRQQQRDLMMALTEAREHRDRLAELNRELEDTNRGVVALYAELDEKADALRHADAMKSRFLSNMSHEFRTPLNSIRALTRFLLERVDGPLAEEQERQVRLIGRATDDLSNLVEDLLDLARIEAGKLEVRASEFSVQELFSTLRGMLRPLLQDDDVVLRFEPPSGIPPLCHDEAKLSQILRNFVSNALKFTERGSIVVSASLTNDESGVEFWVEDTGIGIAPEDQERIFDEFVQVRGPLQARAKGTGLGLPLCRRLATLLGGGVRVASAPGVGSRFSLSLPIRYAESPPLPDRPPEAPPPEQWRIPVLVVDDEHDVRGFYESLLKQTPFRCIHASTLHQATSAVVRERPAAVILDILLQREDAWRWLAEIKGNRDLEHMPLLVVTTAAEERKALALGANDFIRKPADPVQLLDRLDAATASRVLLIEDDATTRYAISKLLRTAAFVVSEAANGEEGMRAAEALRPRAILLDLGLPDIDGFAMLDRLCASATAGDVAIVVGTARDLTGVERRRLDARAFAVLSKREMMTDIVATVAAAVAKTDLLRSAAA